MQQRPDLHRTLQHHTRYYSMAGQIIIKIAYGIDMQPKDDPYVDGAEDAMKAFAFGSTPQAELLDTLPLRTSPYRCISLCVSLTRASSCEAPCMDSGQLVPEGGRGLGDVCPAGD